MKIVRTTQPREPVGIDWSNEFARGLIAAAYSLGGPKVYDAVARQPAFVIDTDKPEIYVKGGSYRGSPVLASFTNTSNNIARGDYNAFYGKGDQYTDYSALSICAAGYTGSNTGGMALIESNGWDLLTIGFDATQKAFAVSTLFPSNMQYATAPTADVPFGDEDTFAWVGGRYRYGTGIDVLTRGRTVASYATATQLYAGAGYWGVCGPPGSFVLGMGWNRALSDDEFTALYDNPWQLFEPERRAIFLPPVTTTTTKQWHSVPLVRTTQPQEFLAIDWSNPLAQALAFAHTPGAGAVDLVSHRQGVVESSVTATKDKYGRVYRTSSASNAAVTFGYYNPLKTAAPYGDNPNGNTIFALARPEANGTAISTLFSQRSTSIVQIGLYANCAGGSVASGTLEAFTYDGGATRTKNVVSVVDGTWKSFAATFAPTPTGVYVNGLRQAENDLGTGGAGWYEAGSQEVCYGRLGATFATGGGIVDMAVVYGWNRALTPAEILALHQNPWQLFLPDSRVAWFNHGTLYPTLSVAELISVLATQATPRVTIDWP
jgi:hypothetical protein